MLTLFLPLIIPVTLVCIFRLLNKQHTSPIFGVYQQRNKYYWIKFAAMYIFLGVRKTAGITRYNFFMDGGSDQLRCMCLVNVASRSTAAFLPRQVCSIVDLIITYHQLLYRAKRTHAVEVGRSGDGTIHVHQQDVVLEQKYYLGDHAQSVDAVYFNALSKDGEAVVCGLARRPKNICDAFLYIKVKGQELLLSPNLPDTQFEQNTIEQGEYKVEGIEIVNFMPMRTWKLNYKGEMKPKNDPDKRIDVEMHLTWSAHFAAFNYDTQVSPRSMASDMAREQWSRDYFKLLKKCHQTHYEQMGSIEGTVTIDGKEHVLNMPCVRDHSFGPFRDWRTFHRYVYHFIFLENGDCMAVGAVSQPAILSHLTIGYLCRQSDQTVHPVVRSDFKLYHHGENQILPKDYGFTFKAGRQTYVVRVQVKDEDTFYIGKSREAKFHERWSEVDVNGVKGWACVEWQYNNVQNDTNCKDK